MTVGKYWFVIFVDSCWCGILYKYFLLPTATPGSEEVPSGRCINTNKWGEKILSGLLLMSYGKTGDKLYAIKHQNNSRASCIAAADTHTYSPFLWPWASLASRPNSFLKRITTLICLSKKRWWVWLHRIHGPSLGGVLAHLVRVSGCVDRFHAQH